MAGSNLDRELDTLRVVLGMPMVNWQDFVPTQLPPELRRCLGKAGRNQLQTLLLEVVGRLAEQPSQGTAHKTR